MPRKNAEPKGPPETVDLLDSDDDEPVVVNGKRRVSRRGMAPNRAATKKAAGNRARVR